MSDRPSESYLHGYSTEEQERLLQQGEHLEPRIYPFIDFSQTQHVVEVGSGVGAQTRILLRRFPHLKISAIDRELVQIERAKVLCKGAHERVSWTKADATALPFKAASFDGGFLCWILEHADNPQRVVDEVFRVLSPGGVLYATEVYNRSFYTSPDYPAISKYWAAFNEEQVAMGGDPYIGARLTSIFHEAGFRDIKSNTMLYIIDRRLAGEDRRQAFHYWRSLLLSAAPGLLKSGRLKQADIDEMTKSFDEFTANPSAVFYLTAMQASGRKP